MQVTWDPFPDFSLASPSEFHHAMVVLLGIQKDARLITCLKKTPWCCSSLAFGGCPDRSMLSPNNQTIPVRVTLGAKNTPDASLHLENLPLKKMWRIKIYEISTPISNSFYNLRRKISFKMWRTQPGGISKLLAPPWWSWTLDTTTPKAPKKKIFPSKHPQIMEYN